MAVNKLLAVAPFAKKELLIAQAITRSSLGNLPFTKQEVESIETLYETTALYEQAASKNAFLAKAPDYQSCIWQHMEWLILKKRRMLIYCFIQKDLKIHRIMCYTIMKYKI